MKSIYEPLFEPLKIGDVEVKNKFLWHRWQQS